MKKSLFMTVAIIASGAVLAFAFTGSAYAVPIGYSLDGPGPCDAVTPTGDHELGPPGPFPDDQALIIPTTSIGEEPVCLATNVLGFPDTLVTITNVSGVDWEDVWFISDWGTGTGGPLVTLTNVDHYVNGAEAFRIDSVGVNTPLLFESGIGDNIFQDGETWRFVIQDWGIGDPGCPAGPAPGLVSFVSPGRVGIDSCFTTGSNASIIASRVEAQVPEPATLTLFVFGLAGLGFVTRRRRTGVGKTKHA